MSDIKSPAILNRISRFIIIQIVFVFAALALVLFYNADNTGLYSNYNDLREEVLQIADQLHSKLTFDPSLDPENPELSSLIDKYTADKDLITDIKLVPRAYFPESAHRIEYVTVPPVEEWVMPAPPILTSMSEDNKSMVFTVQPENSVVDYAVEITSSNIFASADQKNLAYLLVLLFLISALISLLLIHLLEKSVRRPLAHLAEGFAQTARAEQYIIEEECRDPDMKKLIVAFNRMSKSLSEQQKLLKDTNRELVKTNASLKESESFLTSLIDFSPEAIIVTDLEDKVIIYNLTAAEDFGFSQTDMLGRHISGLINLSSDEIRLAESSDGNIEKEIICSHQDNSTFPALLVYTPLGLEKSKPIARLYFLKNISESKNYQDMILKLDRVASRGKMAREVAHEINNYLAILQGNLELTPLLMAKGNYEKAGKKIEIMRGTVEKITRFTEGLTRFSDENSRFDKEDLNQLVENLVAFVKPQNRFDDIRIETHLANNVPLVEIDAGQIQLLLVNLLNNASEALDNIDNNRTIRLQTTVSDSGGQCIIAINDNGPGIPEDYHEQMFMKRFSTRQKGNGLGLITCKGVVDNHKGEIDYIRNEDGTTTFKVKIPIHRAVDNDAELEMTTSRETHTS